MNLNILTLVRCLLCLSTVFCSNGWKPSSQIWMSQCLDGDSEEWVLFIFSACVNLQSGWGWKGSSDSAKLFVCLLEKLLNSIHCVFMVIAVSYLKISYSEVYLYVALYNRHRRKTLWLWFLHLQLFFIWRMQCFISVKRQEHHLVV